MAFTQFKTGFIQHCTARQKALLIRNIESTGLCCGLVLVAVIGKDHNILE